jgi:hypothetical protein
MFASQHGGGSHGGGSSGGGRGAVTSSAPSGGHSGALAGHSGEVRGGHEEVRGGQVHQGNRGGQAYQGNRDGEGQRGYNPSGRSYRIPQNHYNAYFGQGHSFHPWHSHPYLGYGGWGWGGRPHFWYGGLYWGFSAWPYEVWPYYWDYDDSIYIVVENDTYYAKDDAHPERQIALTPAEKEDTGTVKVISRTEGDSIFIDKALAGYTGELKSFRLSVGQHTIEVKGQGPYFGEDIMVIADHELKVEVPN